MNKSNAKKNQEKYKFIDLFAGIGGTRIALERAGAECVFSSEWDTSCRKTYIENFSETPKGDITKIKVSEIPYFDILVAGFPCQPFSSFGEREGFKHVEGTLFYDIARILNGKKPSAFLLENVPGLLNHDNGKTFTEMLRILKELGYFVFTDVLDAKDFGTPQKRKRVFFVGFHNIISPDGIDFKFPKGSRKKVYISHFVEEGIKGYSISKHLQKTYIFKVDDGNPEIINKESKIQVKTLVASYHKIQRLTGTFVKDGETGLRLLTENECKAIMGFPLDFKVPVSRTQMYRQFGNSVAIPVVEAIAKGIINKFKEFNNE